MAVRERVFRYVDSPMSWTRAIVYGFLIWVVAIALLGQVPSLIIYKFDQYVTEIINFSKSVPFVNDEGLNPRQIEIIRDLVANGVQMTFLAAMLIGAYIWQERKRKRTGGKGLQDVVKGYMPGK